MAAPVGVAVLLVARGILQGGRGLLPLREGKAELLADIQEKVTPETPTCNEKARNDFREIDSLAKAQLFRTPRSNLLLPLDPAV